MRVFFLTWVLANNRCNQALKFLLVWWVKIIGSQCLLMLPHPHPQDLWQSLEIFLIVSQGWGSVLLAYSGQRQGFCQNPRILKAAPTKKSYPAYNANCTKTEKPWYKEMPHFVFNLKNLRVNLSAFPYMCQVFGLTLL